MPKTHKIRGEKSFTGKMATRKGNTFRNPTTSLKKAIQLSEKFHGRKTAEILEIEETEIYPSNLSKLGDLVELELLTDEGATVLPIDFKNDGVHVSSNPSGTQIYFIGGNQNLNLGDILDEDRNGEGKRYVLLGPLHSITYYTDKHHLEGPKYQKTGSEYEHIWGEDGGEIPNLVYDLLNRKMMLVGGSYKVEEEGIKN